MIFSFAVRRTLLTSSALVIILVSKIRRSFKLVIWFSL